MKTFMYVSEDDLMRIYELARRHSDGGEGINREDFQAGRFFSNGEFDSVWEVREILPGTDPQKVRYRIVAGPLDGETGTATADEFMDWVAYPVIRDADSWKRMKSTN